MPTYNPYNSPSKKMLNNNTPYGSDSSLMTSTGWQARGINPISNHFFFMWFPSQSKLRCAMVSMSSMQSLNLQKNVIEALNFKYS